MISIFSRRWQRVIPRIGLVLGLGAAVMTDSACHGLLDVSDPTLIQDKDIANADGANSRRMDVVQQFHPLAIYLANDVAVFTDELEVDLSAANTANYPNYYLDRRDSQGYEALFVLDGRGVQDPHLGNWDNIVVRSSIAIPQLRAFSPDSVKGDFLAEMYAFRGYTILQMAEDICSGFPINDLANNVAVYGPPYTTDSAIAYAITQLDTVLAEVHDSTALLNFARVVKGRALLDLGHYAEAAAMVAAVPTDFSYSTVSTLNGSGFNTFIQNSRTWRANNLFALRLAAGDAEGTNGQRFVSAQDPRARTVYRITRYDNPVDSLYEQAKYTTTQDSMVLASGIEARLIEAEAALSAGDPSWFTTLNTLRATMITPAMAPIPTMPTAPSDQVDLLYQERAFWLYLTGRRLGDLRRLIRNYGRNPETVFPTGPYPNRGGVYGTATAIPFVQATEASFNPHIVAGCTTR